MDVQVKTKRPSFSEVIKENIINDLGPKLYKALQDPLTITLLANADGRVWQETLNQAPRCIEQINSNQTESIIRTVSSYNNKEVYARNPFIEGVFPLYSARFAGHFPPNVEAPIFVIRKPCMNNFSLADLVDQGMFNLFHQDEIMRAI